MENDMKLTPEELERTIKEIAKSVLYVAAFVALVTVMVLGVAVKDAQSETLPEGLQTAMANDFLGLNEVCAVAFELYEPDPMMAVEYYDCMAHGYKVKAKIGRDRETKKDEVAF